MGSRALAGIRDWGVFSVDASVSEQMQNYTTPVRPRAMLE